jgi:long-chain acyl-CoA synthetase
VLARVQAPDSGRAVAIAGDITAPRLGLAERHDELAGQVGSFIHSAASVAFDLPLQHARAINVDGTRRVLEFAAAVPELERIAYVSTAYVAGDRRGIVYEDDREVGRFRNSYEQSKHEAEAVVRESGLPSTIVRPSIVVGESTTGWTAAFNVLYAPLRGFAVGAYKLIPARKNAPVDVVPVDFVADGVVALAQHPEASGGTFHLTAGPRVSSVGEIMAMNRGRFDHPSPKLIPPRAYRRWVHPVVMKRAAPSTRRVLDRSEVYFPYFSMRMRFDTARARALLEPMGIAPPALDDYYDRLIEFARAARWGRRPLDRGAAAELAGTSADVRAPVLTSPRGPSTVPV